MVGHLDRLRDGQITLAEWQRSMERDIKSAHLTAYAMQRGGWQNMTQADYGRVGRLLYNPNATDDKGTWGQYQFLRDYARHMEKAPITGSERSRTRLYARAARMTYHKAETLWAGSMGFTEEAYILNPADHCTDQDGARQSPPRRGCTERARAGWNPIGTWPNIGEMACHSNDRCSKEYRSPTTGQTWKP